MKNHKNLGVVESGNLNKKKLLVNLRERRAITLIALIITIAVMLILVNVIVTTALGENGLITKARKNSFYQEMIELDEKKKLSNKYSLIENAEEIFGEGAEQKKQESLEQVFLADNLGKSDLQNLEDTLKAEIIYVRNSFGEKERLTTIQIWKNNMYQCQDVFTNETDLEGMAGDIYYIKKEVAPKEREKAYIYDSVSDVCFKIEKTKLGENIVHSLPYAKFIVDGVDAIGVGVAYFEAETKTASDETKFYEPDLNNFSYNTKIIYYSPDFKDQKEVSLKDYIDGGRQNKITVGDTQYTFADYTSTGTKIWANVKTTANGLDSWWVWIPRYAYELDQDNNKSDICFVDINDEPLNPLPEGKKITDYTVHEAFKQNKKMKGFWFSKYEPSAVQTVPIDKTEPVAPDLSNFDTSTLKIVYYSAEGENPQIRDYTEEPPQTIQVGTETYYWYNYTNKIWANVKTTANGLDSWWVWIPRYAYKLESGTTSIILVDENNKPLDTEKYGVALPEGYTVHEAFNQDDGLMGIWFSKYEPTAVESVVVGTKNPESPDMSSYNNEQVKLLYYTADKSSYIEKDYTENPAQSIVEGETTYYWYDYQNNILANIKTDKQWTWIPRYAYKVEGTTTSIILINASNNPIDTVINGETLPQGYTVYEEFIGNTNLGIWFNNW